MKSINIIEVSFSRIRWYSSFVHPSERVAVVADDPDDDKFIACAVAADSGYIITGDPHLLTVGTYQNVRILTPAQFLDSLEK